MSQEQVVNLKASASDAAVGEDAKRERSAISFPYGDLENAIEVVKAVNAVGGQSCAIDQLAAYLQQSANSGSFKLRLSFPRIFGLSENERGEVTLTDLGLQIIDPTQEAQARVTAFLNVPLYKAVYEKYKGYVLPPAAGLEREMLSLGVSSKQTDKARQVFDRSAKQAGFYSLAADRLTIPSLKNRIPETKPIEDERDELEEKIKKKNDVESDLHPFIQGLLKTLPAPDKNWPMAERKKWLSTAESIFGLIYKDDIDPMS